MITPRLVPGKRYPVFFEHYGGPGAQQVKRAWMGPMPQYWVSKGWIYFQIDNRGSANRGTAFGNQIYHAMGTVEVADQATGARWLQQQKYVDPKKIAIFGWSYGGYMTLKMLEAAPPGLYAAGVVGRAGDALGAVRHALHRALPRQSGDGAAGLCAVGRDRGGAVDHARRCC